ncbi:Organelle RRM domain-containing protein 1 chloroplastic [Bienertia sinuspersici]
MELIHSSHSTLNLRTSFTCHILQTHYKPPLPTSTTFHPWTSTIPFKPNKVNFFQFLKPPYSKITTHASTSTAAPSNSSVPNCSGNIHWMVLMDKPAEGIQTKAEIINYYVNTLKKALGSEEDAKSCIYDVSCHTKFGFCCIVDEETSRFIAGLPGVLCVKPDTDINSVKKDYNSGYLQQSSVPDTPNHGALLFPKGSKNWLVRVEKPPRKVSSKAQIVDSYVNLLTKVLGNERDAQMCIYHVSWQSNFGFCCQLDEQSAQELATVPGVLSVQPDEQFESEDKNYGGVRLSSNASGSTQATNMSKTKLFITGLSFYTSENTLREAFEPFGELVEVKVIMDKISKRSKGYAFVEYTAEDAATTALQEMNGKIINGWMIVVDRAKVKARYSKERSRPLSSDSSRNTNVN